MSTTRHITSNSVIYPVSLDEIVIDPRVQRKEGVNQRRVNKMAANFDPHALGVLILSYRRDGSYVCLDGMHRRAAAIQAGWVGPVDARVFTGLSLSEEAALFLLYNDKKDPSAVSRFGARVTAGEPIAVDINDIVTQYGWKVAANSQEKGILSAVDAMEQVYRTATKTLPDGAHPGVAQWTIAVITAAWGHDPAGVQGAILGGVSQLYGRFSETIDSEKLVKELQNTLPRRLVGNAKVLRDAQGGNVPAALAKILVGLHNNRRRTNLLPEWVWTR